MRLERIRVKHFRSIESCDIGMGPVTALVGENNSGKSSLLRALNAFFNYEKEREDFHLGRHQYGPRTYAKFEFIFGEIPEDKNITQHADNGKLRLMLTCRPNNSSPNLQVFKGGYQSLNLNFLVHLRKYFEFVLIPANRDVASFQWQEEALLPIAVDEYLAHHLQHRDTVTPRFKKAADYLDRTALSRIAKKLSSYYSVKSNIEFQIGYESGITYKDFLHRIGFKISELGGQFDVRDCGAGIQSLSIIALYRLIASLRSSTILIGVEEPETNLHPQSQKQLVSSLQLVDQGPQRSQIIFTTHSTVLLDQIDHSEVVLVRKVEDDARGFKAVVKQIAPDFFGRNALDPTRYSKFHKYKNSDFFYSKLVILVESTSDVEVVRELMKKKGFDIDRLPISILNLDGVENLKYPFYLLNELGIPYFIVLDKDWFLPYLNDDLENSRDQNGFPKYRFVYKQEILIEALVSNAQDRSQLLKLFRSNHSRALDLLEQYNIVCMKYSLDIDLVASKAAAEKYFEYLNVPQSFRLKKELLINRKKQIKRLENLLVVVRQIPHKNLPNSYKRIKKVLPKLIHKYCHG